MVYPDVGFNLMSLRDANLKSKSAEKQARSAQDEVDLLRADVERLLMLTEALWMLIKKQHNLDDSVLAGLIEEIDMRDGQLDGRVAPNKIKECPSCKRPVAGKRSFCVFCGVPVPVEPFER